MKRERERQIGRRRKADRGMRTKTYSEKNHRGTKTQCEAEKHKDTKTRGTTHAPFDAPQSPWRRLSEMCGSKPSPGSSLLKRNES